MGTTILVLNKYSAVQFKLNNVQYNKIMSENRLRCMLLHVCASVEIVLNIRNQHQGLEKRTCTLTAGNVSFVNTYVCLQL